MASCHVLESACARAQAAFQLGAQRYTGTLPCHLSFAGCRDTFNPASANSVRFANRGGSIFASQLAQHLGLTPTTAPAAASGCVTQQQQLPALASWCSAFRQGRQQPLSELSAATGCPAAAGSFGVLEPSVLDSCAMSFSAGQVAALQAAVAMYRPKLHATYVS